MLKFLARVSGVVLGVTGIAWGVWQYRLSSLENGLVPLADRVLSGGYASERDITERLSQAAAIDARNLCLLDVLRARVILRLRLAEDALTQQGNAIISERMSSLKNAINDFRACYDGDGFVDLSSYWIAINETGNIDAALPFMRKSFEDAPGEGWIIAKRAWLAFGIFESLPDELKERLLMDVVRMNKARLTAETAELIIHLPPAVRHRVIARLKSDDPSNLEDLKDVLQRRAALGVEFN